MTTDSRILIVEDDWIVAHGLRDLLYEAGYRVIGIAAKPLQVQGFIDEFSPTLALVDINLGKDAALAGIELARKVLVEQGVQVIFTSAHSDEATLALAATVGAAGFVVKPFTQKQLRAAIEIALGRPATRGGPATAVHAETMSTRLAAAQKALDELAAAIDPATASQRKIQIQLSARPSLAELSEREHEVLRGLLKHRRVPAIAEDLGISAHTVRNHLKAIFGKLRVSSQQELLDLVIERSSESGVDVVGGPAPGPQLRRGS